MEPKSYKDDWRYRLGSNFMFVFMVVAFMWFRAENFNDNEIETGVVVAFFAAAKEIFG